MQLRNNLLHHKNIVAVSIGISMILWPYIPVRHVQTIASFTSGKWQPMQALIVQPLQIILAILLLLQVPKLPARKKQYCVAAIITLLIGSYLTQSSIVTTSNLILIILGVITLPSYVNTLSLHFKKFLNSALVCSGVFQSCLAIMQFFLQKDLGLQILNEPIITHAVKGIAKLELAYLTQPVLRSYGTFAHPNILAVFLFIVFMFAQNQQTKWRTPVQVILILGILTTFSRLGTLLLGYYLCLEIWSFVKQKTGRALPSKNQIIQKKDASSKKQNYSQKINTTWQQSKNKLQQKSQSSACNKIMPIVALLIIISILVIRSSSSHTLESNQQRIGQYHSLVPSQEIQSKRVPWEQVPIHNSYIVLVQQMGVFGIVLVASLLICTYRSSYTSKKYVFAIILVAGFEHFLVTLPIGCYMMLIAALFSQLELQSQQTIQPQ